MQSVMKRHDNECANFTVKTETDCLPFQGRQHGYPDSVHDIAMW